jgi:hypothetical protein
MKLEKIFRSSTTTAIGNPKDLNRALRNEIKQKTKQLKSIKENSLIAQQNADGLKSRLDVCCK